jgi:hypothetical protein
MNEFDSECPRCKRQPAQESPPAPAPLPVAEPVPVRPEPKGKAMPAVVPAPRSNTLTVVLVAVGVVIVLLLAALLWTQMHKSDNAASVAAIPQQKISPAASNAASVAAGPQTNQLAATTNAVSVAASPQQNAAPATTNAVSVASGQQQNVPAATTNAGGVAEGEDEAPWQASQVASWAKVYDKTGSGQFTTPELPVHRPWSIEYYSGVSPASDLGLDIFSVFPSTSSMQTPVITVSKPGYHDTQPCYKRGPTSLEIVTVFNDWRIIVYQGTFKPGQG